MRKRLRHLPLKKQLNILIFTTVIPLTIIGLYLLYALLDYSRAYQSIVSNISTANQYSQAFKPEMDEDIYRIVVSGKTCRALRGMSSPCAGSRFWCAISTPCGSG